MDLVTQTTTARVTPLQRLGARRLTRAHLSLETRPSVRDEAQRGLSGVCAALQEVLGAPVQAEARLLEASFELPRMLSRCAAFAVIELGTMGECSLLELELPLLVSALGRLSGNSAKPSAASSLTRIEEAAFGYLCLLGVAALRQQSALKARYAPHLSATTLSTQEAMDFLGTAPRWMAVELSLSVADVSGLGRLYLPSRSMQCLFEELPRSLPPEAPSEVLAARLPGRVLAGRSSLPLEFATQLAVGDVVTFEDLSVSRGCLFGPARILTTTFELTGAFSPAGFEVLRAADSALTQESNMNAPQQNPAEPLPNLTVDVEIELTRLRLPLSELSMLRSGGVLALRCNASEPVTLRVGDRAVARAELVEIEGELGARILQLLP